MKAADDKTVFDLEEYLSNGVSRIVKGIVTASIRYPRAGAFFMKAAIHSKNARKRRQAAEAAGEHIPPFLIASITRQCNLHCKGCYAWANHAVSDGTDTAVLTAEQWGRIFGEADELGVEFILLAGGEPFVRTDVLLEAGRHSGVLFPVFTNGTMMDEERLAMLDKYRNLLPIISLEGSAETTDRRRGKGVYARLTHTMELLARKEILYGASVTVTKQNVHEVLAEAFVAAFAKNGGKAIVYVEYVPVGEAAEAKEGHADATVSKEGQRGVAEAKEGRADVTVSKEGQTGAAEAKEGRADATVDSAPDDATRLVLEEGVRRLRERFPEVVFVSFPGDEKASGGCLAAGRGFFHINAYGGAEPCPFSPYSDRSVVEYGLREALRSPLFLALQRGELATLQPEEEHLGGCVLFSQRESVEALLSRLH